MSASRISKRKRLSRPDAIPAHHLDPIQRNPAPPGHPAHEAWEIATRQAEVELFDYQAAMLQHSAAVLGGSQMQTGTGREFGQWYVRLAFSTLQIWAKRTLCIVKTYADARAYEKWLGRYAKSYLREKRSILTEWLIPNRLNLSGRGGRVE